MPIEPKRRAAVKALRSAMKTFSNQALELDRIFSQTVEEASSGDFRFHENMRMALRAQAQYRATLKILLALASAGGTEEKTRNSSERTIADGDSTA